MASKFFMNEDGTVKPSAFYGLIAILILVGAYFAYRAWRSGDQPLSVTMACWSERCGYARTNPPELGEVIPAICPKCGKQTLAPAYRCAKCGTINVWNTYRNLNVPDKCSKCGQEARRGQ